MIISASRRTDIPAFYSDWFINRINSGYLYVVNPMNRKQISKIQLSPNVVDCIVFWSKNPNPIISKLNYLSNYNYYFQYTITAYDNEIERNLPSKSELLDTFKRLSDVIGPERVIWRYDPIFYTDKYTFNNHLKFFSMIAKELSGYTHKCIISFLDSYKKTLKNMKSCPHILSSESEIVDISKALVGVANHYDMVLETCAEEVNLKKLGIDNGKCIDDKLVERIAGKHLAVGKDKTQREVCGCVASIDIGAYNTCNHHCLYCYANFDHLKATVNFERHNPHSELLFGELIGDEKITLREMKSLFADDLNVNLQGSLF